MLIPTGTRPICIFAGVWKYPSDVGQLAACLTRPDTPKGPSQKYLEANEVKYFSLGGGGGRQFHGHYFTFSKKSWRHACVYHHRMKPKVGRNFTSESGGGGQGRSEKYFTSLASRYF